MANLNHLEIILHDADQSIQIKSNGKEITGTKYASGYERIPGLTLITTPQKNGSLTLSAFDTLHQAPDEAHPPFDLLTITPDNKIIISENLAEMIATSCFQLK